MKHVFKATKLGWEKEKEGMLMGMPEFAINRQHLVIIKHSVSAACQNDPAEHEPLPDSRME